MGLLEEVAIYRVSIFERGRAGDKDKHANQYHEVSEIGDIEDGGLDDLPLKDLFVGRQSETKVCHSANR